MERLSKVALDKGDVVEVVVFFPPSLDPHNKGTHIKLELTG